MSISIRHNSLESTKKSLFSRSPSIRHPENRTWQATRMRKFTTVSVCCLSMGLARRESAPGSDWLLPNTYERQEEQIQRRIPNAGHGPAQPLTERSPHGADAVLDAPLTSIWLREPWVLCSVNQEERLATAMGGHVNGQHLTWFWEANPDTDRCRDHVLRRNGEGRDSSTGAVRDRVITSTRGEDSEHPQGSHGGCPPTKWDNHLKN